jgi:hypothetical protein
MDRKNIDTITKNIIISEEAHIKEALAMKQSNKQSNAIDNAVKIRVDDLRQHRDEEKNNLRNLKAKKSQGDTSVLPQIEATTQRIAKLEYDLNNAKTTKAINKQNAEKSIPDSTTAPMENSSTETDHQNTQTTNEEAIGIMDIKNLQDDIDDEEKEENSNTVDELTADEIKNISAAKAEDINPVIVKNETDPSTQSVNVPQDNIADDEKKTEDAIEGKDLGKYIIPENSDTPVKIDEGLLNNIKIGYHKWRYKQDTKKVLKNDAVVGELMQKINEVTKKINAVDKNDPDYDRTVAPLKQTLDNLQSKLEKYKAKVGAESTKVNQHESELNNFGIPETDIGEEYDPDIEDIEKALTEAAEVESNYDKSVNDFLARARIVADIDKTNKKMIYSTVIGDMPLPGDNTSKMYIEKIKSIIRGGKGQELTTEEKMKVIQYVQKLNTMAF